MTQQSSSGQRPPIQLSTLTMLNLQTGWALEKNNTRVFFTHDGPTRWMNITPPGLTLPGNDPLNSITASDFPDTAHGYLGVLQNGATTLLISRDSGKTWQSVPFDFSPLTAVGIYQIDFLDAVHGWLAFDEDHGFGNFRIALMSTSDGGKTWQRLVDDKQGLDGGLPIKDPKHFLFTSPKVGWMTGPEDFAPEIRLYATEDGGKTWQRSTNIPPIQNVAFSHSYGPYFNHANDGTLPVTYGVQGDNALHLAIYRTDNGGKSWSVVQTASSNTVIASDSFLTFRNAHDGWLLGLDQNNQPILRLTQDGGVHWKVLHPIGLQGFNGVVLDLKFLTSTTGWLVTNDTSGNTILFQTNDAGQNWQALHPVLR
ncbi:MAG: hypothetical protein JO183_05860 [Ktedonobacteraceae bacterium]|nr:hypothetical protein [Ktedonobacteraceae bacterium]MBV9019711.1 hypothetical protein [Ktedonobacteraceae bacterium]